jgi:predicted amidohydrolase
LTTSKKELVSLQFPFFEDNYEGNLNTLLSLVNKAPKDAVVVAPELCLTNFSFDKMEKAAAFGAEAKEEIKKYSHDKIITLSMTEKIEDRFYNSAKIFYKGEEIYSQPKAKLFAFGDEDKYFSAGDTKKFQIVEIEGLRYAILICFEIRFVELWLQIQGADIIMIPALWGKLRKEQLEAITKSMGIINQAFVVLADSANDDMAKSSGIITPFGEEYRNDDSTYISHTADLKDIKKMRRYMDIGLT